MNKIILSIIVASIAATGIVATFWSVNAPTTPAPATPVAALPLAPERNSLLQDLLKQRWLVVFQNPYELRATGGFWGTIGSVQWDEQTQAQYWVNDVYAIDGPAVWNHITMPEPPKPIQTYIRINQWYLRDANWDPDFPTSTRRALSFYDRETNGKDQFTAVAAINPDILKDILTVTGPITVDGVTLSNTDTIETIIEAVEIRYRKKRIVPSQRKTVLYHLVQAIVNHPKRNQVLLALTSRLPHYQRIGAVQLFANDPRVQKEIEAAGWSGALKQSSDDYLMVVDSNLAALKTDAVMVRKTEYAVVRSSDYDQITATLTYINNAKKIDYRTTRYRTYTRLFAPAGAVFQRSSGTQRNDRLFDPGRHEGGVDVQTWQDKTVFGFFLSVEPGTQETVVLRYRVPRRANQDPQRYQLLVQHQAGVPQRALTVTVQSDTTPKPPVVITREGSGDEVINTTVE